MNSDARVLPRDDLGPEKERIGFSRLYREREQTLLDFIKLFWRQKWIVAAITAAGLVCTVVVTLAAPKIYEGTAHIRIYPEQEIVDIEAVLQGIGRDMATIRSEIMIIESREHAAKVLVAMEYDASAEPRDAGGAGIFSGLLSLFLGDNTRPNFSDPLALAVENFLSRLSVSPISGTQVISVSYRSLDPQFAADAANYTSELYLTHNMDVNFEAVSRANLWLAERLRELGASVRQSEFTLERYRAEHGLVEIDEGHTAVSQQIAELNSEILDAEFLIVESRARLAPLEALLAAGDRARLIQSLDTPGLIVLRGQEMELNRELAELSAEFGPRHPRMVTLGTEVQDIQMRMGNEAIKAVDGMRIDLEIAETKLATLQSRLSETQGELSVSNEAAVQMRALEREVEANRLLFEAFLARSKETAVQDQFIETNAEIISRAVVPLSPVSPNLVLFLSVGFIASIGAGLGMAFVIELVDNGFKSSDQIFEQTGMATYGLVPTVKLRRDQATISDYLIDRPASALGEALRSVFTSLLVTSIDKIPKTVLVTSSVSGEGKTSICVAMAIQRAQAGQKALVIDCDFRRPSVHNHLSSENGLGLTDLLMGECDLDEAIKIDEKSGLHFLTAGTAVSDPTQLFLAKKTKAVLAELSDIYDLLIIDSPPLQAVSDARLLAQLCDAVLFVVHWGKTQQQAVVSGMQSIAEAHAPLSGVILSRVDLKKHAQYSYSDSGYYYGRANKYYTQ